MNLDPDPGIRPNLDPAPDPVFKVTLLILRKKCLKKLRKRKVFFKKYLFKKIMAPEEIITLLGL